MKDADLLRLARERYQEGVAGDRDNRDRDQEQREFYRGRREDQWDSGDLTKRKGRISVAINRCPQFVKQITGEMRQNKPAIRVLPVDDKTDPKLAEVYSAIIRHIESQSSAHRVYTKAAEQAVIGGIGWFRILTANKRGKTFDQEIMVKHIRNPLAVVVDPGAIEPTRCDMEWAFVSELIPEAAFKAKYPKASLSGFDSEALTEWRGDKTIRVAEYWVREAYNREMVRLTDGSVHYTDELTGDVIAQLDAKGVTVALDQHGRPRVRDATAYRVKCYKISGVEVLETYDWAGSYIPLIPVIGEEIEVGDEVFRHGLVYPMMDSQRAYNFARSAMLETVASQPKAPFLVTTTMVKNHAKAWEGLNDGNPPVLPYDPDPLAPSGPQRLSPPNMASAWYQEAMVADGDMKATTGIYDASLGEKSNETSGVAIRARDQQGETASYVYVDNESAAIEHAGRIMIELIPEIYTEEQSVRLIGEDGAIEGHEPINVILPDGTVLNDLSAGQFDLEVTTGPAFATKRMEAADTLMALAQSMPEQMGVAIDLLIKSLDIPYGEKIAERMGLAFVPPGIDADLDKKRVERQQQMMQTQGPPPPDPAQEVMMAAEVAKVENTQADTALKAEKAKREAILAMQDVQELALGPIERGARFAGMGDGPKTAKPAL